MHGTASVTKMRLKKQIKPEIWTEMIDVDPELAMQHLDNMILNRPVSDATVDTIAGLMMAGLWKDNGETIKFSPDGRLIDGQHRMWAVVRAKKTVRMLAAYNVPLDAVSTIDTLCKPRTLGDTIALAGTTKYRNKIAHALAWLLRWQSGNIVNYRAIENRVYNHDIERAFATFPDIARSVEKCAGLSRIGNVAILAFLYHIIAERDPELADKMVSVLEDPAGIATTHPFFVLRDYFLKDHHEKKDPLVTIAAGIKAANAAAAGKRMAGKLYWRSHGRGAEAFPELEVGKS